MEKSKGIELFIVEGITDEISLGLILSKIIEKNKTVKFKIINGDITTEDGTSPTNILKKISSVIKEFTTNTVYTKKDIKNVIHLVDIDGVYIENSLIKLKDIDGIEYCTDYIYTRNVENIAKRNEQKARNLNKLIETDTVYAVLPYEIYFFSSNLEHVLHNEQMVEKDDKSEYAQLFEDKFADNPSEFIEFINNHIYAVEGDYKTTWKFIKNETNSLNRHTNFHLYINNIIKDEYYFFLL